MTDTTPIPLPDDAFTLGGDNDTDGAVAIGVTAEESRTYLTLWDDRGAHMHHVTHLAGTGGTNLLNVIAHAVADTPLVECWHLSNQERSRDDLLGKWRTVEAIVRARARQESGYEWTGPAEGWPLLLILVDGAGLYPEDDREASRIVRRITALGPAVGVALVLASRTVHALPADVRAQVRRLDFDGSGVGIAHWVTPASEPFQVFYCEGPAGVVADYCRLTPPPRSEPEPAAVPPLRSARVRRFLTQTLGLSRADLPGALRLIGRAARESGTALLMMSGAVAVTLVVLWLMFPAATASTLAMIMAGAPHRAVALVFGAYVVACCLAGFLIAAAETLDRRRRRRLVARRATSVTADLREVLQNLRDVQASLRDTANILRRRSRSDDN
jgi:hypothetical protein